MSETLKTATFDPPLEAAGSKWDGGNDTGKIYDPEIDQHRSSQPPGTTYSGGHQPSSEPTDEQLLAQYRQGNQGCFRILVDRYQRELFHFLVRFLGDRSLAEDTFQETFLQVHESASDFDVQRRFRPWLFTIAANKARDMLRFRARRPAGTLNGAIVNDDDETRFIDLLNSNVEVPEAALEKNELSEMVHHVLMQMPEPLREILLLAYFSQFPYKQISDILGIPLGTVKSRLHTAVGDFANRWKVSNHGAD